jgi:hypothetical protein
VKEGISRRRRRQSKVFVLLVVLVVSGRLSRCSRRSSS